ncbi:MAG: SpoIIE family protein phosphatase [Leptospiraceae bacterium]|nr:SpoIIE family protein phosphatase [Leptospiraceae bacterium]
MKFNKIKLIKPLAFSLLLGFTAYYLVNKIQSASIRAKAPTATKGILDTSDWDFPKKGFIKLDGAWEFYWQNFYTPEDFKNFSEQIKTPPNLTFQNVPSVWNSYRLDNNDLPGDGFATYRLRIKIKDSNQMYAIKVQDISTSYQIWIDGILFFKAGKIGKSKEEMEPSYKPKVIEFKPEKEFVEIIFQISNFHHAKGGLWNFIEFGLAETIEDSRESQTGFEFFMFGSLSIMSFYHFGLYILRRKDRSTFYFGMICLTISLRILLTGERFIFNLLDDSIFWSSLVKLEFMTVYLTAPFFVLFLESMYPEDSVKIISKITLGLGILFSFATLFIDTTISTGLVKYFQLLLLFLIFYTFYILTIINIRKREGAVWMALGLLIFLITLTNDLLYLNNLIYTGFLFPLGLFVFIFSQSFILSMRFSKAFATVESMSEKLLTLDKLKDDFMANTSHELRTPLNGIIGIAESMLDDSTEDFSRDTKQNLSLIVSSGRRLNSLVNDILDFSKLKNHEIELQIRKIDLKQIADLVLKLSEPLITDKDLRLTNAIPDDFPEIEADENRIIQIFHNLIGNAIKFTESGEIRIFADHKNNFSTVYISDTGIGIPEEKYEVIFQSFEQMDTSIAREYGGTGLGLGITKQLVELHGGKIWVNSVINKGSTFYFTIPTLSSEEKIRKINEPEKNGSFFIPEVQSKTQEPLDRIIDIPKEEKLAQRYTILAVDDEPINLQVMVNHLKDRSYRVLTANNGQSALKLVENEVPDLILLDIMMPKLSGYEVCKILREKYPIHTLPIIILSAKNQVSDIILGLEYGANDYLHKPFHKKELISRIHNQLSIKRAIEDNSRLITMEKELQTAKKIQEDILPDKIPTLEGIKINTTYLPMQTVGGDLYDFHSISKSEIGVLIADVAGHGVSAAIIMGMVKLAFKMHKEFAKEPAKLLQKMNETLYGIAGKGYVTAGYCYINLEKRQITFSSAGHPALILLKNKSIPYIEMQPKGKILGAFPNIHCNDETHTFNLGDKILLYTDGILEVRKEINDAVFYGEENFKKFIQENRKLKGKDFLEAMIEDVTNYRDTNDESTNFEDDITLVSIDII